MTVIGLTQDQEELKRFLELLFPDLEGRYIEIRCLPSGTQNFYSSIELLLAEWPNEEKTNVYFGVNLRTEKSGTKKDVNLFRVLFADLDAKDFKGGKAEALKRLNEFRISPTIIVDTGNGYHAYWLLKEPEIDQAIIEEYLRRLCFALGGDRAVCQVACILRLPGTFNCKNPSNLLPVQIIHLNQRAQYNLGDFEFLSPVASSMTGNGRPENKPDWIVEELADLKDGNRNQKFCKIIGRFIHDGHSPEVIFAILEPHAKKVDFPSDELRSQVEKDYKLYAGTVPFSPLSLISLQRLDKKWPDAPRDEAYYGLAGDIVRLIGPHSESDPVALLIQTLVMFGNIIGRNAHFMAEADKHPMGLFAVLVGRTAKGRKGTSHGQIKRLFETIEPQWALSQNLSGLSSGEGLIWAVRDPITKKEPIKEKQRVIGYQDVVVDEGVSDKRLLITESEFASILRVLERDGNTLSPLIRQAWDTGILQTLTKNSSARSTNAHISIIAHITKEELCRYLNRTEAGNGFGNRFLWLCAQRFQMLPEGGRLHTVDFSSVLKRLKEAIEQAKKMGELIRDELARQLWIEKYPDLSKEVPGLVGALTARAEAQVMRLACIYALLDCSPFIRIEHLQAALALWEYVEDSAAYIFGGSFGDPVADTILASLRGRPQGLSRTEISNLFGHHTPSVRIAQALGLLLEHGLAKCQSEPTRGRHTEIWFAVAKEAKNAKEMNPAASPDGALR